MDRPWDNEPDRVDFKSEGLQCAILRTPKYGNLCGYVRLPDFHPLRGTDLSDEWERAPSVHGGWSYSEPCLWIDHEETHGQWWIGFDCAHGGDLFPRDVETYDRLVVNGRMAPFGTYRDIGYVRSELEKACSELVAMLSNHQRLELFQAA